MNKENGRAKPFFERVADWILPDPWGHQVEAELEARRIYSRVESVARFHPSVGSLVHHYLREMLTIEAFEALPKGFFYTKNDMERHITEKREKTAAQVNGEANRLFPNDPNSADLAKTLALRAAVAIDVLFKEFPNPMPLQIEQRLGENPSQLNQLLERRTAKVGSEKT